MQIHTNGKAKAVRGHHLSKSVVDCISDTYAFFSVYKITAKSLATKKNKEQENKTKEKLPLNKSYTFSLNSTVYILQMHVFCVKIS